MKTLADLLRDADPLSYEPRRSDVQRRLSRQRVSELSPVRAAEAIPTRRQAIAVAATVLVTAGITAAYFSRMAVDVVAAVRFEVRLAEEAPAAGLREAGVAGGTRKVYLHEEAVLTNADIARAEVIPGATAGTFGVALTFSGDGASKIGRATGGHVGKPLAILIDGVVVMAPVVRSPITTSAVISGDFTRAEAERIVAGIVGR